MFTINKIRFKGLGRFVERQEIDLESRSNLIQVDAKNLNTGGSSGSGKTTVFKAVDYLLGISDTPASVLKSRYSKELEVEADCSLNGESIFIKRSTKTGLELSGPDFKVSGNSDLAEEKLDQILGMPRDLYRLITHKKQGQGGFFLNLTPKETFEFLMKCLKIDNVQPKIDSLSENISILKPKVDHEESKRITLMEEIERYKEKLQNEETSYVPENVSHLLNKNDEISFKISNLNDQKEKLSFHEKDVVSKINKPSSSFFVPDQSLMNEMTQIESIISVKKQELDKEITDRNNRKLKMMDMESKLLLGISSIKNEMSKMSSISKEIDSLSTSISSLDSHSCPTCSQHWNTPDSSKKKSELIARKNELEIMLAASSTLENQLLENQDKLSKLRDLMAKPLPAAPQLAEIQSLNENLSSLKDKLDKEKQEHAISVSADNERYKREFESVVSLFRQQRTQIELAIENLSAEKASNDRAITSASMRDREHKTRISSIKTQIEDIKSRIESQDQALSDLKHRLNLMEEARRFYKSYSMRVFEDALSSIGERASSILSKIPNTSTATIYFESFKEISSGPNKGRLKEEISPMLSMDGEESVPVKSISGGERASVDLAVDLAVIDLIEERSGLGANYFILDEPCTGMDSVCKEQYVEILRNSGSKKKIIIVDHSSEIKEMVCDTITVIRDGIYSRISS